MSCANFVRSVGVAAFVYQISLFESVLCGLYCDWRILLVGFDGDSVCCCSSSGSSIPRSRLTALPHEIFAAFNLEFVSEFFY